MPMHPIRIKKITTEAAGGTDSHTVVLRSKIATNVTAKERQRSARDMAHLP
jgi:hypothetical protein